MKNYRPANDYDSSAGSSIKQAILSSSADENPSLCHWLQQSISWATTVESRQQGRCCLMKPPGTLALSSQAAAEKKRMAGHVIAMEADSYPPVQNNSRSNILSSTDKVVNGEVVLMTIVLSFQCLSTSAKSQKGWVGMNISTSHLLFTKCLLAIAGKKKGNCLLSLMSSWLGLEIMVRMKGYRRRQLCSCAQVSCQICDLSLLSS